MSEREYFNKLIKLLSGGGTLVLRQILEKYSSPLSFVDYVYHNQATVLRLKFFKDQRQLEINRDIAKMDITLLGTLVMGLFRNKMTAKERTSVSNIKEERNNFMHSGVLKEAKIEEHVFKRRWKTISSILLDAADEVGPNEFKTYVETFIRETQESAPQENEIREILITWCESNEQLAEQVRGSKEQLVKKVHESKEQLVEKVRESKEQLAEKVKQSNEQLVEKVSESKEQLVEKVRKSEEQLAEKVHESKEQLVEKVRESKEQLAEKVHESKEQLAEQVRESKEQLAEKVRESKEQLVEQVRESKEQLAEKVRESKEQLVEQVRESKEQLVEKVHESKEQLVEKVRESKEQLVEKVHESKEQLQNKSVNRRSS